MFKPGQKVRLKKLPVLTGEFVRYFNLDCSERRCRVDFSDSGVGFDDNATLVTVAELEEIPVTAEIVGVKPGDRVTLRGGAYWCVDAAEIPDLLWGEEGSGTIVLVERQILVPETQVVWERS